MRLGRAYGTFWTVSLALLLAGCRSEEQPTAQPAPQGKPALTLIAPPSVQWSREEACAKLPDPELGLSAAVRLVRLARVLPLCVPGELTDAWVRRLRLVSLSEETWALALADARNARRLHAPVVIAADGKVTLLADGADEEMLVLYLSADADVFPHLALLPDRVVLFREQAIDAITLAPDQRVRFELRRQGEYPYVGLVLPQAGPQPNPQAGPSAGAPVEVARYSWDPFERAFAGPAADRLPDPPGGRFEVDLDASPGLVPMGGEIPETAPSKPLPPRPPRTGEESLPT